MVAQIFRGVCLALLPDGGHINVDTWECRGRIPVGKEQDRERGGVTPTNL